MTMKPKWLLIEYDSSSPLVSKGQDNVFVRDSGDIQKNVVEIFVLSGPMRKESWATIRANVEGSRFRDEGIIVYPRKRAEDIVKIFTQVFEDSTLVPSESNESESIKIQYFEKFKNLVREQPHETPVLNVSMLVSKNETVKEDKLMVKKSDLSVMELLSTPDAFDAWFASCSEEDKSNIENTLIAVGLLSTGTRSFTRIVDRVFRRMAKITDVLVEEAALRDVLTKIADGIADVLGKERVAVAIDAFDERVPNGGAFKGIYILRGGDKIELENMKHPFRPRGGSAGKILDVARALPPANRAWFIDDVRHWPPVLPVLRYQTEGREPDVESLAYLPLIVGQTRVGLAVVQFSEPHKFSGVEKRELNLYAKTAASVLYGSLLKEGTLRRPASEDRLGPGIKAIKLLTDSIRANRPMDIGNLLPIIAEQIQMIFEPRDFYVIRYESATNTINYAKAVRDGVPVSAHSHKAQSGLVEKILRDSAPILITHNLSEYLEKHNDIEIPVWSNLPKSFVGVPILIDQGIYGVIAMQDFEKEYAYSESDEELLVTIANLANLA